MRQPAASAASASPSCGATTRCGTTRWRARLLAFLRRRERRSSASASARTARSAIAEAAARSGRRSRDCGGPGAGSSEYPCRDLAAALALLHEIGVTLPRLAAERVLFRLTRRPSVALLG